MAKDQIKLRHLDIYSADLSPESNLIHGRAHHFSYLTIGKQVNDAANLQEALAKKAKKKRNEHAYRAHAHAESVFRKTATLAFKKHAELGR